MVFLGDVSQGRDNNFNLIRMVAATAVLVSHAFPIALGAGAREPLQASVGHTLGHLAVMVFFIISGFLIMGSFHRSSSRMSFVLARVLRLFPGLAVNLVFVALVMGPVVTVLSPGVYFALQDTYAFVLRNLALVPLVYTLPGVFADLPFPAIVGSIWSLRHEVACYAGLFVAGLAGAWKTGRRATLVLGLYAVAGLVLSQVALPGLLRMLLSLSLPFAAGMALHVWRDRVPLSVVGVLGAAGLAWLAHGTAVQYPALVAALAYGTFWLAYVPGGILRRYNRVGDYSYGVYLYAFPLQGFAVWLFGPQTPLANMLYSAPPTLLLAVLSWHLVEAPAMARKAWLLAALSRAVPGRARP